MCGLVGSVAKFRGGFCDQDTRAFSQLLYADALRGDDSTGVFVVDKDGNVNVEKEATTAGYYQSSKEYGALMTEAIKTGVVMVGHNRAATRGAVTDENAHPFVVDDNIVLVHNGSLTMDHTKLVDVEVDSHAIAHLIQQANGDVEKAVQQITGAYALIWYNVEEKTINFLRNSQRPLHYAETHRTIWWASEPGMLKWVLDRNNITYIGNIKELPAHKHMKWDYSKQQIASSEREIKAYKPYVDTSTTVTETEMGDLGKDNCHFPPEWWGNSKHTETKEVSKIVPFSSSNVRVLDGETRLAEKNGFYIDIERYNEVSTAFRDGQWFCARPFEYDYVTGDTGTKGIFIYARMELEPDMLVRCYVPYDGSADVQTFEQEMLEMSLSGDKYMFKLLTRGWHVHDNPKNDGWGCFYSIEFAKLTTGAIDTETC